MNGPHPLLYDMLLPQASFTRGGMLNAALRLINSSFPSFLPILGYFLQLLHYMVFTIASSTFTAPLAKWTLLPSVFSQWTKLVLYVHVRVSSTAAHIYFLMWLIFFLLPCPSLRLKQTFHQIVKDQEAELQEVDLLINQLCKQSSKLKSLVNRPEIKDMTMIKTIIFI